MVFSSGCIHEFNGVILPVCRDLWRYALKTLIF